MINQCDGCRANQSRTGNIHFNNDGIPTMICESNKYIDPTHYAVIDEQGEILHASRIMSSKDAEMDCRSFIDRMDWSAICLEPQEWTVKRITVHEE